MIVSALCVGLAGSKSTRLLKHGMAGHIVEMVGLSLIAKPCGKSSRSLRLSTPPVFGACPSEGDPARTISAAEPTARRPRLKIPRFIVNLPCASVS